jgi:hypothetical protein
MARKPKMSFKDAMNLVPDDLPDGAFFAMAHEIAGLDYGDGFDELAVSKPTRKQRIDRSTDNGEAVECNPMTFGPQAHKPWLCKTCNARFRLESAARQHWNEKHK